MVGVVLLATKQMADDVCARDGEMSVYKTAERRVSLVRGKREIGEKVLSKEGVGAAVVATTNSCMGALKLASHA